MAEYKKPGCLVANVGNRALIVFAKLGISISGANVLSVKGRKTGKWHSLPVNPLTVNGRKYLVSPRGDTQWARNVRAGSEANLRLGRKTTPFKATELADADKAPIIRAYLDKWAYATAGHFGVPRKGYTAADIERVAPRSPVFSIE